jgi:hypothetical protein
MASPIGQAICSIGWYQGMFQNVAKSIHISCTFFNPIVRMGILNCFDEFSFIKRHHNVVIASFLIGPCLSVKEKKL